MSAPQPHSLTAPQRGRSAPNGDAVEHWFATRGWQPFAFQREVWDAYRRGESGLVHAATGTGKTLAAWMGPVIEWRAEHERDNAAPARANQLV